MKKMHNEILLVLVVAALNVIIFACAGNYYASFAWLAVILVALGGVYGEK